MIRLDHKIISDIVSPGSKVLDLGCGDGELLALLQDKKRCRGTGIEIDDQEVMKAIEHGVSVAHGDIDRDLDVYADLHFDYVILNESLQQVLNIEKVLKEALRIGKRVVVGVPNFCHIGARAQIFFKGRMPVTRSLPYRWYDTPNLRFLSLKDFRSFCGDKGISIENAFYFTHGDRTSFLPNLFADAGIFILRR